MKRIKCNQCGNVMQVDCRVRPKTEFRNCSLVDVTIGCRVVCEKCKKEHNVSFEFDKV